jgi:8-oxo-dGTP pyrophosphatase MutT (NUDIX family)
MNPGAPRKPIYAHELEKLAERLGQPRSEQIEIAASSHSNGPAGFPLTSRRTAEVVLVVPRPAGRVLVHTKNFYPSGIWRLPTGGIHRGESIEAAVRRESVEETGLALVPERFLFHLRFCWDGFDKDFQSFGFLMNAADGRIQSRDPKEQITAFRDSTREEIEAIAQRLETLQGNWSAWGRFRAAPHRVLLRVWPSHLVSPPSPPPAPGRP